jgi:beta-N-acetylhexosaminidase
VEDAPHAARVQQLLDRMTLEEKVGQLFMVFFRGATVPPALATMIRDQHVGGIVLFNRTGNLRSLPQATRLISAAQQLAIQHGARLPLFVAVDQEGGIVDRLPAPATDFPGAMALGAAGSVSLARRAAEATAVELRAVGVNMNLAPVLDVNDNADNPVIGVRSFGSSPQQVAALGEAMIEAYRANRIIAVAKHFPGHGNTSVDSHRGLPEVPRTLAQLWSVELVPFQVAVSAGVDAIMTAHVSYPYVEPDRSLPATLSPRLLQALLREGLGFGGVILSDSMTMGAIAQDFGVAEACVMAFRAGADLLTFDASASGSATRQRQVMERLIKAIREDGALQARLEESARRILLLKARAGILDWAPPAGPAIGPEGWPEHRDVARQVARAAITLVKDDGALVPIRAGEKVLLIQPSGVGDVSAPLRACHPELQVARVALNPSSRDAARLARAAESAAAVVVVTSDAREHPGQARLVAAVAGKVANRLIVAAVQSPYDLLAFPGVSSYLAAYSDRPVSLAALAEVLCGGAQPAGRLPVALPGLYPRGHGLSR